MGGPGRASLHPARLPLVSCSPASRTGTPWGAGVGTDGPSAQAMGAFVWSFLLRKGLSGLPELPCPCCQGTVGWHWPRCWLSPHLQALLWWWRSRGSAPVGAVGGMVPAAAQQGEELPVPCRAAVRGCRCHFVLRVCCSCLPAGLGGAARGPRGHPALLKCGKTPQLLVGACQLHRRSSG